MKIRRMSLGLLVTVVILGSVCQAQVGKDVEWESLFDGKTLTGWKQLGGKAKYAVEDGAIVGTSVPKTPNSFLCTEKMYGDFILELELKVDPNLNSGVQIRSNSFKNYKDGRVHGYQVEIDPSKRAFSGGIYDEARRAWLNDLKDNEPARKAFKVGQWNKYRIEAVGDSIKTWVNDVPAADLVDSMTLVGFIGLQVHSTKSEKPLTVRWRNIRIKDLGRHVWWPIFDGKGLRRWHTLPGGNWEVKNGIITGTSSEEETRHGMLVTNFRFSDFTARLKFKARTGNSGFYFRADKVEEPVGVHGFQAEIDTRKDVGGLYETGGRGWVVKPTLEEFRKYYKLQQWNQMTVSAHGRRIVVHINGHKTADLKDDPGRLNGHLGLQLHGGQNMNVMFKDIEILQSEKRARVRAHRWPVIFEADFEDRKLDAWQPTDPQAWRVETGREGRVLSLSGKSNYKPPVRSPLNINLIRDVTVASFELQLKMLSTSKDYAHRDLCLFFGHQDPSHFYYVHIANKSDPHSNSIFLVDGKDRVSIAKTRTEGTPWDEDWHTVRLVRDVDKGTIQVFVDNMRKPIMTAEDKTFKSGRIGVGSFDDTGQFDDIHLTGLSE
ncbi:MAG: 3-keto-disaccharide hydrolase [Planctomycetota bacterium]